MLSVKENISTIVRFAHGLIRSLYLYLLVQPVNSISHDTHITRLVCGLIEGVTAMPHDAWRRHSIVILSDHAVLECWWATRRRSYCGLIPAIIFRFERNWTTKGIYAIYFQLQSDLYTTIYHIKCSGSWRHPLSLRRGVASYHLPTSSCAPPHEQLRQSPCGRPRNFFLCRKPQWRRNVPCSTSLTVP